jgi:hypothetical protein
MSSHITVRKNRTNIMEVQLAYDVSSEIITSQIRKGRTPEHPLICEWLIRFKNDGKDGSLIFTLDDSVTSEIEDTVGYMDILRISGGEPITVIEFPLIVFFQEVITV